MNTATITYVIPEGPSEKAGIRPGDQLIKANGILMVRKNNSTDTIRSIIKGERNSIVNLTNTKRSANFTNKCKT